MQNSICLRGPAWAPIQHFISERLSQLSAGAAAPLSPLGPALAGAALHFLRGSAYAIREQVECEAHTLLLGSYWEDFAAQGAPANGRDAASANSAAPPEDIDAKLLVPRGKSGEAAAVLFASIEAAAPSGACALLGPAGGALAPFAPGAYDISASGLPTVCTHGTKSPSVPSTSYTARPMRVMMRMLTATYGLSDSSTPMCFSGGTTKETALSFATFLISAFFSATTLIYNRFWYKQENIPIGVFLKFNIILFHCNLAFQQHHNIFITPIYHKHRVGYRCRHRISSQLKFCQSNLLSAIGLNK
jgi:hypothetical protein